MGDVAIKLCRAWSLQRVSQHVGHSQVKNACPYERKAEIERFDKESKPSQQ
jgi:hypothetical protein